MGGLGLAFALALVCCAGVAWGQQPSEESFNGAGCYGCHRAWSPVPMRTMFVLHPATDASLPLGVATDYGVRVEQAWVAKPPWPQLTHFEAFVDLAGAPSLGFASQQPPLLGVQSGGVIAPAETPLEDATAFTVIRLPPGTSDLVLTLSSNSTDATVGPDLRMLLHPGRERPGMDPIVVDEAGRGAVERFVRHGGHNITALGGDTGTLVVEALVAPTADPADVDVQVEPRPIPFTVTMDAYRNLTGESRQFVVVERVVDAGQSTLLTFALQAVAEAQPGEHLLVTVNATAFYEHSTGGGRDDWGNFSKSARVDVAAAPGAVVIGAGAPAATSVAGSARFPLDRVAEAVGYLSAFLILASIASGGMLGAASRRGLNRLFGTARRRVAFHNELSYLLILVAVVHTVLFVVEQNYYWTLGILWGGLAILAMAGLGVTGAFQVAMIRRWDYAVWRWSHLGLALGSIAFTVVHMGLDGANFGFVQDALGWQDPFPDPREVQRD